MHPLLRSYQDRKKLKWQGMLLSEHTAQLHQSALAQKQSVPLEEALSREEIEQVLAYAFQQQTAVDVQLLQQVSREGHIPRLHGIVQGFTDEGVVINETYVEYPAIRYAALSVTQKWSAPF